MNIPITDTIIRIDTSRDNFNMQDIENRRFMFNPKTATLILGYQYRNGELVSSHADEYASTGTDEPFDDFVRGWIGTGKEYTDGVIHFAPSVSEKNITLFEKAFDTLEMFKNNGARKNTVVRGLGRAWEQSFSDLIKEVDLMAENISSVTPIEFTGKTQKEKVKEITDKLEQGIKDLFNSDRYKEYLSAMSKFHNYSFRNTILILMQKPDASYIAGFNTWKNDFKRAVRKGEKGIKILAPAPYKKEIEETAHDKNGNPILNADGSNRTTTKTITVPAFKITTVFDLSQTDGKEIPTIANQLTGNVEDYEKFFKALKAISPVPIELEKIDRAANGYYHLTEKRIAVRNDLSEMQTIKTAIHEIAHAKLHELPEKEENEVIEDDRPDNRTREVQAESIAYTVCQHFGIDTSDYSFGYVAGWSSGKETAELKASLEVIRTTADEMITDISEKLKELEKEKSVDLNSDISAWYAAEFSDDEMKDEIYTGVSFQKLYDMLSSNDLYSIIGIDDTVVRERCFSKLAELMQVDYSVIYEKWLNAEIPDMLNPTKQPVVTILWSESPHFETGQKMPLNKADKLFTYLDESYPENQGYDKTKFRIDYMYNGMRDNYIGRYDIGDRENGLINHIENHFKGSLTPEYLESVRQATGQKGVDEVTDSANTALNLFVPYLRLHISMSEIEETANMALKDKTVPETDKAYYSAMCDYVHNSRVTLNTALGEVKLPEPPQKEDFIGTPTMAESEQKAKTAQKTDKKPSIRKQLNEEKAKTEKAPKKAAKSKKKEDISL